MDDQMNRTMQFTLDTEKQKQANEIIMTVFKALQEKGYNPTNQFIGYILSGDPTYITSHNNARAIIRRIERDEILEELLRAYLEK